MSTLKQLETVRVGVIGPSWWVDFWHLPAIQSHPHAQLAAICGAKERNSEEVRAKYGEQVRSYTNWETMLAETPLDGVVVCTPNDLHHPATMAALRHGLHVTCEKPVALNAAQAREMAGTARSKGLLGMCNFPYRDNPAVQTFRRLVAEGYLGRLLHIRGEYHGGFGLQRPPNWRADRGRSGGGILGDLGSHLTDLIRFVTGNEFTAVCAHSLTLLRDSQSGELQELIRTEDSRAGRRNDDSCAFLAELSGGAQGVLHTSWAAYQGAEGQHQEIEAYGTNGRLHFVATHAGTFLRGMRTTERHWETFPIEGIVTPGQAQSEHEDYFRPGRQTSTNTTYRWIEAIRTGQSTISPSLEDGWRAQQVIDAVIASSAARCWREVV